MNPNLHRINIVLDIKTQNLLDTYAADRAISRSAAIRLLVNDFFIKQGG